MRIIIDCNSISELVKTQNLIKLWWYRWEICVYDNEELISECLEKSRTIQEREAYPNTIMQNICWCQIVNKFKI